MTWTLVSTFKLDYFMWKMAICKHSFDMTNSAEMLLRMNNHARSQGFSDSLEFILMTTRSQSPAGTGYFSSL